MKKRQGLNKFLVFLYLCRKEMIMKKIVDFAFNDVVLYSKGWYERTGDIFEDIRKCLEEDNHYYVWPNMGRCDICRYMLMCLDKVYEHLDDEDRRNGCWLCSHAAFLDKINHYINFYEKTYEEAVVYTVLEVLSCMSKDQIELKKPVYGKGRRRIGLMFRETPKSMTYKEMNKIASKTFDEKD